MNKSLFFATLWAALSLFTACGDSHDHEADSHADEKHTTEAADDHAHGSDEILFTKEQADRAHLQVTELQPSDFTEVIEVSGRVLPAQGAEATVSATMAGIVQLSNNRLVDGSAVSGGQALFVINAQPMADGNPAGVAQAELTAATRDWERAEKLAAEKIISQRELEAARQRYETALSTARSLGSSRQSRTVSSPLAGYIKTLLVKSGDYVTAGQPLATVTQSKRLILRADVPERHYAFLPNVTSANFRMAYDKSDEVYSMTELDGRLLSKGQVSDPNDFFVPVTFEFNNRGHLVSGSFAQVYLQGSPRSNVLSVPVEAVSEAQGLHFVYLQIHDDAYQRQAVTLGATDGRRIEILSGVKAGDKVVTRGTTQVRLAANASVVPEGHKH